MSIFEQLGVDEDAYSVELTLGVFPSSTTRLHSRLLSIAWPGTANRRSAAAPARLMLKWHPQMIMLLYQITFELKSKTGFKGNILDLYLDNNFTSDHFHKTKLALRSDVKMIFQFY